MRELMRALICWSMVLLASACGPDSPCSAEGTWSRDGDFLILEPGREEGEMKGQLRRLKIVVDGASPVFVPEEELRSEHFLRYGANNFIGFHRLEDRD